MGSTGDYRLEVMRGRVDGGGFTAAGEVCEGDGRARPRMVEARGRVSRAHEDRDVTHSKRGQT